MDTREKFINKLHFVWLGAQMGSEYVKNIIKWSNMFDCEFDIYMWVDRKSSVHDSIQKLEEDLGVLHNLAIYDVNDYIFTETTKEIFLRRDESMGIQRNTFEKLKLEYEYEIGITPRPQVGNLFNFIKNYGFSSDIIRLMILSVYGGFYCDVDMEPFNICEYQKDVDIKTCPIKLCFTTNTEDDVNKFHGKEKEKEEKEGRVEAILSTGAIYMDNQDDKAVESLYLFFDNIITFCDNRMRRDEYNYIIFDFVNTGINATGPAAIPKYKTKSNHLYGFYENNILGAEHSWFTNSNKYIRVLDITYSDIFLVYSLRYNLQLNNPDIIITKNDVEEFYYDFHQYENNQNIITIEDVRSFKNNKSFKIYKIYRFYLEILYDGFELSMFEWDRNYTLNDLFFYIKSDCKQIGSNKDYDKGNLKSALSNFLKQRTMDVKNYGTKLKCFPSDFIIEYMDNLVNDMEYDVIGWEQNNLHSREFFSELLTKFDVSMKVILKYINENKKEHECYVTEKTKEILDNVFNMNTL